MFAKLHLLLLLKLDLSIHRATPTAVYTLRLSVMALLVGRGGSSQWENHERTRKPPKVPKMLIVSVHFFIAEESELELLDDTVFSKAMLAVHDSFL